MYEEFSTLYDKLTFDIDYPKTAALLAREWKRLGAYPAAGETGTLVELGCGTGNLTCELKKMPFSILAMDIAEEMLQIAWEKVEEESHVQVVKQNMIEIDKVLEPLSSDVIVAMFDTMNYLMRREDFQRVLEGAYRALRKGGVFSFDLNSKNKLFDVLAENTYCYEVDGVFYTWESERDGDLVHFYLNFFIEGKDGRYTRIDEGQVERYYATNDVIHMLKAVGFQSMETFDLDTGGEVTEETQRILFSSLK